MGVFKPRPRRQFFGRSRARVGKLRQHRLSGFLCEPPRREPQWRTAGHRHGRRVLARWLGRRRYRVLGLHRYRPHGSGGSHDQRPAAAPQPRVDDPCRLRAKRKSGLIKPRASDGTAVGSASSVPSPAHKTNDRCPALSDEYGAPVTRLRGTPSGGGDLASAEIECLSAVQFCHLGGGGRGIERVELVGREAHAALLGLHRSADLRVA